MEWARDMLKKEFLAHIGWEGFVETKKAYFLGYMVHKLCCAILKRRPADDRDNFGNKRLQGKARGQSSSKSGRGRKWLIIMAFPLQTSLGL